MKHDFSIRDIVGALKTVRVVKNYYSDAQLAHLVDEAREVNAILDALPEPEPVADEWEQCEFEDIQKGDRVKIVSTSRFSLSVRTREATAHCKDGGAWLDENDETIVCGPYCGTQEKLYRIPVQHPDPEQHPVIFVGATEYREGGEPFAAFRYGDKYKAQWHDQPLTLSSESITDWWPALVVADDRGDA